MGSYSMKVTDGFDYWMDINVLNNTAEFISHELIYLVTMASGFYRLY